LLKGPRLQHTQGIVLIDFRRVGQIRVQYTERSPGLVINLKTYAVNNQVYSVLLSGANPETPWMITSIPTTSYETSLPALLYSSFFSLSTVEANWDLDNLGRGDTTKTSASEYRITTMHDCALSCLSDVLKFVASVTGSKNIGLTSGPELAFLNLTETIPGLLNPQHYVPYLEPNTSATGGGKMIQTHLHLSTIRPLVVPSVASLKLISWCR